MENFVDRGVDCVDLENGGLVDVVGSLTIITQGVSCLRTVRPYMIYIGTRHNDPEAQWLELDPAQSHLAAALCEHHGLIPAETSHFRVCFENQQGQVLGALPRNFELTGKNQFFLVVLEPENLQCG